MLSAAGPERPTFPRDGAEALLNAFRRRTGEQDSGANAEAAPVGERAGTTPPATAAPSAVSSGEVNFLAEAWARESETAARGHPLFRGDAAPSGIGGPLAAELQTLFANLSMTASFMLLSAEVGGSDEPQENDMIERVSRCADMLKGRLEAGTFASQDLATFTRSAQELRALLDAVGIRYKKIQSELFSLVTWADDENIHAQPFLVPLLQFVAAAEAAVPQNAPEYQRLPAILETWVRFVATECTTADGTLAPYLRLVDGKISDTALQKSLLFLLAFGKSLIVGRLLEVRESVLQRSPEAQALVHLFARLASSAELWGVRREIAEDVSRYLSAAGRRLQDTAEEASSAILEEVNSYIRSSSRPLLDSRDQNLLDVAHDVDDFLRLKEDRDLNRMGSGPAGATGAPGRIPPVASAAIAGAAMFVGADATSVVPHVDVTAEVPQAIDGTVMSAAGIAAPNGGVPTGTAASSPSHLALNITFGK